MLLTNVHECKNLLQDYLVSRGLGSDLGQSKQSEHRTFRYLKKLVRKSFRKNLEIQEHTVMEELNSIYPLFGLSNALKSLSNTEEEPSDEQLEKIVKFVDIFSTVSLHPSIVRDAVSSIATDVNQHKHTKTCRKYLTTCRFHFPKLPAYRTVIAKPAHKSLTKEERNLLE